MWSSTVVCRGRRPRMGSLIEELRRREEAARAEADRLRARIEELTEELARAEEQVSRLAITREEVTRVLEEPPAADTAWQDGGPGGEPGHAPRIGAVAVPPWQEGAEPSVLPRSYRDLLEVAGGAGRPARGGGGGPAGGGGRGPLGAPGLVRGPVGGGARRGRAAGGGGVCRCDRV